MTGRHYLKKKPSNRIHSKGWYQVSVSFIIMAAFKNPVGSHGVGVWDSYNEQKFLLLCNTWCC